VSILLPVAKVLLDYYAIRTVSSFVHIQYWVGDTMHYSEPIVEWEVSISIMRVGR